MTALSLRPSRRMPQNPRSRALLACAATLALLATILVGWLGAGGANAATGTVYYLSPAGSDSNPGTAAAPWQTLGKAFATLHAGDTALLASGTYGQGDASALTWTGQGSASAPITIKAAPGAKPVVAQLVKLSGSYLHLSGLTIVRNSYPTDSRFGQGGSSPGGNVDLWADGCSHCTIAHNEIQGATMTGLFINGSDSIHVLDNWIHGNGTTHDDHGIYFCSGADGLVAHNLIEHNYDFGLQLYCGSGGPTGTVVTDNTIVNNGTPGSGGSGIVAEVANGRITNNVLAGNVEYGIRGWDGGTATVAGNYVYSNGSGPFGDMESGYSMSGNVMHAPKATNTQKLRNRRLAQIRPAVHTHARKR
jgi:Right handed beta helix region